MKLTIAPTGPAAAPIPAVSTAFDPRAQEYVVTVAYRGFGSAAEAQAYGERIFACVKSISAQEVR